MPLYIPSGYLNVHYQHSLSGSTHMFSTAIAWAPDGGIPNQGAFNDAADAQAGLWENHVFEGLANDTYTFTGVYAEGTSDSGAEYSLFIPVGAVGLGDYASPPPNCSILIKKQTSLAGRQHRGRCYLPPWVDEALVTDGGAWDPSLGAQGTINTLVAQSAALPTPMSPRLLHENPLPQPDTITGLVVSPLLATQRRRLR